MPRKRGIYTRTLSARWNHCNRAWAEHVEAGNREDHSEPIDALYHFAKKHGIPLRRRTMLHVEICRIVGHCTRAEPVISRLPVNKDENISCMRVPLKRPLTKIDEMDFVKKFDDSDIAKYFNLSAHNMTLKKLTKDVDFTYPAFLAYITLLGWGVILGWLMRPSVYCGKQSDRKSNEHMFQVGRRSVKGFSATKTVARRGERRHRCVVKTRIDRDGRQWTIEGIKTESPSRENFGASVDSDHHGCCICRCCCSCCTRVGSFCRCCLCCHRNVCCCVQCCTR